MMMIMNTTEVMDVSVAPAEEVTGGDEADHIYGGSLLETNPNMAYPYLVATALATGLGVSGNAFIVLAHVVNKRLRKNGSQFQLNMAIADLIVTGIADPLCIVGVVSGQKFFEDKTWFCELVACLCLSACFCAFLSLGSITLNRYIRICHHQYYSKLYDEKKIALMCVCSWILAFGFEMPNFLGWGAHTFDKESHQCIWDRTADHSYSIFVAAGLVMGPILMMYLAFGHIFIKVRKSSASVTPKDTDQVSKYNIWSPSTQRAIRMCKTIFVTVIAFTLCWTPYSIVIMIDPGNTFPFWVHLWTTWLAHTHSVATFFIYLSTNQVYRQTFKQMCGAKVDTGEDSTNTSTARKRNPPTNPGLETEGPN